MFSFELSPSFRLTNSPQSFQGLDTGYGNDTRLDTKVPGPPLEDREIKVLLLGGESYDGFPHPGLLRK